MPVLSGAGPSPAPGSPPLRHVVVVGASMAGLLAARAVGPYAAQVTVVDRDRLPHEPVPRGGVPQGRHVHGLLSRGREVIEELFPGTTRDLVDRGALLRDAQVDGRWHLGGGAPLAAGISGLEILAVSRPLLEWSLRRRLAAGPTTEFLAQTSTLDLAFSADRSRVEGVVVADCDGGPEITLPADLVVDASGRTSRTPEWLQRRGYPAVIEDVRRIDKHYTTRVFRRPSGASPFAVAVSNPPGTDRGGILLSQEGDRCIVSLTGVNGERPPLDLPGFLDYARSLGVRELSETLVGLEPLDDGLTFRFPANRRRHYEKLTGMPDGLVVTGDALCAFDPVFGQGMTVAALEARELGRSLASAPARAGWTPAFHRRVAAIVEAPWAISAGGVPDADGRVPLAERLTSSYLRMVLRAAADDPVLARAFLSASHLVEPPQSLLRPALVGRVAGGVARRTVSPWRSAHLAPLASGSGSP